MCSASRGQQFIDLYVQVCINPSVINLLSIMLIYSASSIASASPMHIYPLHSYIRCTYIRCTHISVAHISVALIYPLHRPTLRMAKHLRWLETGHGDVMFGDRPYAAAWRWKATSWSHEGASVSEFGGFVSPNQSNN